jgi:hypothetical protein
MNPLGLFFEGLMPLNINELHRPKSNRLPKRLPIYFVLTCTCLMSFKERKINVHKYIEYLQENHKHSFFKMRGADPDNHPELNQVPKLEPSKLAYNRSWTYLRKNGRLGAPNTLADKQTVRKRHQQGVIALSDSGMTILKADTSNFDWENRINSCDVMTSGPLLLLNGKNSPIPADAFSKMRHPRTAVGKLADGSIMLLVVDGRAEESAGMSLTELQQTMRWLGCINALNLDGGGSSAMYIKGEPENGVVNYPADNKQYDHAREREVANTILVIPVR